MKFTVLKTKIFVSPLFFAVLTLILLLDKTGVSCLALLFSLLHELGHFLALICEKIHPKNIDVTLFGIHISLPESMSTAEKVPVLMAGFLVNFLLAAIFFALRKPIFGCINLIIGIFTALPISATDGGSILKAILEEFVPQKNEKIFKTVSFSFLAVVSVFIVSFAVLTKNYFLFIALIYMALCAIK